MAKRPMVNPTTAMPEAPMSGLANLMAMKGRDNDSMLVHLSPTEVSNLNKLSGNTMTINPATGLPEGRSRFLESALPALLSIGAGVATGGMSTWAQMAAAAAASAAGAKLTGKSDDEALTSALLGGATAGLFSGAGTDVMAGGKEAGKAATLAGSTAATTTAKSAAEETAKEAFMFEAGKGAVPALGTKELLQNASGLAYQEAADKAVEAGAEEIVNRATIDAGKELAAISKASDLGPVKEFFPSSGDLYGTMSAERQAGDSLYDNLTKMENVKGLTGQFAQETGMNAMVNQMRADANRLPPEIEEREQIDIYSTPFTERQADPFTQQQIADNFISGGPGSYGMNYLNQAYGQEGGQVRNMNQGGLTQFQSIMGNPALQLQNPNPPMQMAFGGKLGQMLGLGGGGNEMMVSYNGGPKGTSPGGKGQIIRTLIADVKQQQLQQLQPVQAMAGGGMMGEVPPEMLQMLQSQIAAPQDTKSYDVLASIGANPPQQMAGGGAIGKVKDWAGDLKEKFLGSDLLEPLHKASNKMGIMKDEQYAEIQGYAGGGLPQVGQGQASIMQALQPMLQVANERAQQPVQMKVGGNLGNYIPSVGIIGGLLDSLKSKKKDTAPNITNNYYGTSPDGQPTLMDGPPQQMAGGGEIVSGLRAIADNRAFEGRVKGQGDGMSDDIPFSIEGEQPALLARDEYVIPADVVSMIGNGSSDAGADHIDQAIAGIRQAKYGRQQQPRETEGLGGLLG